MTTSTIQQHMEQTSIAKVDRFKCLWTANKHQIRKRWHDGILHFHTFNFRAMLYDEANVLIDDLFIPKQHIVSGNEIEFDNYLVIIEDALDAIYSDISSLYVRHQERRAKETEKPSKTRYLKKRSKEQTQPDSPSINTSLYTLSKETKTKTQKHLVSSTCTTSKKKQKETKLSMKQKDMLEHEEKDKEHIYETFISDDEAYDLFSQ
ncbi:hypothetical protein PNEG_01765 [Pneumocystis murina B123]|uniref:5'-3' DNA helicase ZGRF1-like N-terminal domain-containing protein n=1 Tax=Pneumocystis murina (strain B123) TaxID=1069680 RepID=M7PHS2_PNEMU|nr:hypothetical protein PNEG_01765 [Pneumocystis murina B123]EMR10009.1 hypothetical protein PNEG_01765 [Pneumocystis murina B123]